MNKSEAEIAAEKLLSAMKSKGWEKRIWENSGWHYSIQLPIKGSSGGASIFPSGDQFFCMITTTHLGCGQPGLYDDKCYSDPNKAFDKSLKVFGELAKLLDKIKLAAYN